MKSPRRVPPSLALLALRILVIGAAVGPLRVLVGGWASHGAGDEQAAAWDSVFALLVLVFAVVCGLLALRSDERRVVSSVAVAILASAAASLLAWGLGSLLGAPTLRLFAVLPEWPAVTALTCAVGLSAQMLMAPVEPETVRISSEASESNVAKPL